MSGGRRLQAADLRPFIGPGIRTILKNLENDLSEAELDSMERCFRASYDTHGVRNTNLFEGVRTTLQRLRAEGAELFLVTNKPQLATMNLLEQQGIGELFRDVLSRNSRAPSFSSKAEMLLSLVERYAVEKDKSVMVGDTAEDYEAAHAAGLRFVFAAYGYGQLGEEVQCSRISRFSEVANACGLPIGPETARGK